MYDPSQRIVADYLLKLWRMPLAVLEAKPEGEPASNGMQQASRYALRLGLRFSIASNGREYILTDNRTGKYESFAAPPTPGDILSRQGRNIVWRSWRPVFEALWHEDRVTRKRVRPYQEMAVFETLYRFSQNEKRVLLLMATGTGKTFTVFQLVWKLLAGKVLSHNRVLFLTDRNSLKDQAYRRFPPSTPANGSSSTRTPLHGAITSSERSFSPITRTSTKSSTAASCTCTSRPISSGLVVVDECHRSGFGDWFGVLEYFGDACQLGLTATPREIGSRRALTETESRRDTFEYFGDPAYTYSLKQAIEDGYLVPYLLDERTTNIDEKGYVGPDGKRYTTSNFERDIRLPDRTRVIAEDLWHLLGKYQLRGEKTIVFCVDDTHAAFMAAELRRLSGDPDYAARITRSERNSHQLERNFAEVGRARPAGGGDRRSAFHGLRRPDVKNIAFVRPLKSAILYKQMKGRGTRLCEDIDKRYFMIFDYTGASGLEDTEFDGHPANVQKPARASKPKGRKPVEPTEKPVGDGVAVFIAQSERYVCLADGRKIPFEEYRAQSREVIRGIASATHSDLLKLWIGKGTRKDLRAELKDRDVHVAAFRHFFDLDATDDVDILAKVGFDLVRVPARTDRVTRFWEQEDHWLVSHVGEQAIDDADRFKTRFWQTSLDHYGLYGIDDLEKGATYSAPQFAIRFGSFGSLLSRYGGAATLKSDLEAVKKRLYVPMAA